MFCDLHKRRSVSFALNISQGATETCQNHEPSLLYYLYLYLYPVQNQKCFFQKLRGGWRMFGRWYTLIYLVQTSTRNTLRPFCVCSQCTFWQRSARNRRVCPFCAIREREYCKIIMCGRVRRHSRRGGKLVTHIWSSLKLKLKPTVLYYVYNII